MELDFTYRDLDFINITDKVSLEWTRRWSMRGHTLGEGMVSPCGKYFYLNIPKNSSSSAKACLTALNWTFESVSQYPNAQIIVVLRDPIRRWVSGASEFLMMYHQGIIDNIVEPNDYDFLPLLGEKLGIKLLFDTMTFDDHTERQAVFLNNIDLSRCMWVYSDKNFSQSFSKLLDGIGYPNDFVGATKANSTENEDNAKKKKLQEFLSMVIDKDEFKNYNLQQWFWCDYELINRFIK